MINYANPINTGLDAVSCLGDAQTVNLTWFKAYSNIPTNRIAYHIYYSTSHDTVFSEDTLPVDAILE